MTEIKNKPQLKVIFDTSALFTGSASDLVNASILALVTSYSQPSDITISWHIPSIVLLEREYQMYTQGLTLLPSIEKLERLLGHNLNITADIIRSRVKEAIAKQIELLNLQVITLTTTEVKWDEIVTASLFRLPPFEAGEKEKGFRDSLIAECFMQLVEASPSTPRYCRLAMLTKDGLLASHLEERTRENSNVKIFSDIKDLRGLINTLVSEVKEELIDSVQPKAREFFFVPDDKDTYYFTEKIRDMIYNKFKTQLEEKAEGSHIRNNGTWYISKPEFLSKSGQRITWSTRVDVESKCYTQVENASEPTPSSSGLSGLSPSARLLQASLLRNLFAEKGDLVADGRTTFEVIWSVIVSTNMKFRNPKVEDLKFIEIDWKDKLGE